MQTLGPSDAPIAIVVDYPSAGDFSAQKPLSDYAGSLFFDILSKRGILKSSCFIISLLDKPLPSDDPEEHVSKRKTCPSPQWRSVGGRWVSPDLDKGLKRVTEALERVKPRVVLTLGELALFALSGLEGISKWRGSRLGLPRWPFTLLPTINPRGLVRDPSQAHILQIDLSRAKALFEGTQIPRNYNFKIAPTFEEAQDQLLSLHAAAEESPEGFPLSIDYETRLGHIACLGIAWSAENAICIPFLLVHADSPFYWSENEEAHIIFLIQKLLRHPNVICIGQNISYDCQYMHRHWGFLPHAVRDTMIAHHSIFSNMRKGLDFLSSMYAQDHIYWKGEIKDWDPSLGERQFWEYNCKDACITFEIWPEIWESVESKNLVPHAEFQQSLFFPVLRMMNRGIRIDTSQKKTLRDDLFKAQIERQETLDYLAGHPLNPKSPAQLSKFFYSDLGIPGVKNLTGDSLTTNSPAMALIAEREPVLKKLCQLIVELRSIGVFLSTFIDASLDSDGRMRCSFNIAGPTTYRFSSSENAFGSGMNLQNIPIAEKAKIKSDDYIHLPNIRKLFIPDPGYTMFDMDLDRADLQVVVWEADDNELRRVLREGLDMHCVNALAIFDIKGIPLDELSENHPNYREHRGRIGEASRGKAKAGVHATNYGVGDRKLAQSLGITVHEASRFRARWFSAHPGIRKWHLRTEESASRRGFVENRFGARLYTLGRVNLPELLAWQPQSTVAGVINRALVNIDAAERRGETSIQLQIQVHDSLAGQFLASKKAEEIENLKRLARVEIPYDDPLIIPVGINTSEISWGHCK